MHWRSLGGTERNISSSYPLSGGTGAGTATGTDWREQDYNRGTITYYGYYIMADHQKSANTVTDNNAIKFTEL